MEQKGVGKRKTCIMAAAQEFDTTVVCCTRQFWILTWERGQKHLEREEERLSGARSSHEKKASLPPPLSLLTLLQEDCGNPHEEKVKSIPWKSRFIPFFPGLTQGTSWYKVSEFCFPKVLGTQDTDIIPVVEILPLTQHSWIFQPGTALVQYQQVKVSLKIQGFIYQRLPSSFPLEDQSPSFQKANADFLIKLHL